jgi:hypothetical protein
MQGCLGGPSSASPRPKGNRPFFFKYMQLLDLGYEPAGLYWERPPFRPSIFSYAYSHSTNNSMALLDPAYLRLTLISTLDGGRVVLTVDFDCAEVAKDGLYRFSLPSSDLASLVARHQRTLAQIAFGAVSFKFIVELSTNSSSSSVPSPCVSEFYSVFFMVQPDCFCSWQGFLSFLILSNFRSIVHSHTAPGTHSRPRSEVNKGK